MREITFTLFLFEVSEKKNMKILRFKKMCKLFLDVKYIMFHLSMIFNGRFKMDESGSVLYHMSIDRGYRKRHILRWYHYIRSGGRLSNTDPIWLLYDSRSKAHPYPQAHAKEGMKSLTVPSKNSPHRSPHRKRQTFRHVDGFSSIRQNNTEESVLC